MKPDLLSKLSVASQGCSGDHEPCLLSTPSSDLAVGVEAWVSICRKPLLSVDTVGLECLQWCDYLIAQRGNARTAFFMHFGGMAMRPLISLDSRHKKRRP